jgi:hypothetical protein
LDHNFIENDDELLLNEGWKVRVKQFENPSRVERISDKERAAWLAWVNEVAGASVRPTAKIRKLNSSPDSSSVLSGFIQDILSCPGGLMALVMKMVSSVSVMAFILYIALMVNIRKVFV